MTLRVIGAGFGRTGTMSLKVALERLLGGPCYHMYEVFTHPDHVPVWHDAYRGRLPDWSALFDGYAAAVDFPVCSFYREVADAFPDAPVLLSTRDTDGWWTSADRTVLEVFKGDQPEPGADPWRDMAWAMFRFHADDFLDEAQAKAAYERHNESVRATIPADRLIEWRPGDGWGPICRALDIAIPDEAFPHTNTTSEFRSRAGWD